MKRTVVVMPGDGIGAVVVPEAVRVLTAAGFDATYVHAEIGWSCWLRDGDALPRRTFELLAEHKLGLLGAITSKPPGAAESELPSALKGRGLKYQSPVLALRQQFDQDVCVRPCRSFPGNPTNFVRRLTDGSFEEPALDIVVFRQNTEGLYAGVEWTDPPAEVRRALSLHPKFAPFEKVAGRDLAVTVRIVTREGCRRIVDAAFRYAAKHRVPRLILAEKPNVLRETSGMFEEVARDVGRAWPQIELLPLNIDALLMDLARRPEGHRVIVASNLFGDIVSDAAAGLTGGPGFACSANLGRDVAIFEPTHGSAPRHAAIDVPVVNPIAAILAGALLAEHAGAPEVAERIRAAIAAVIAGGRVRTYDMLRLRAGADVVAHGAATTRQMTDAVVEGLGDKVISGPVPDALPIDAHLETIRDLLRARRAAVVVAPPGAGKTTRVPPALAEDGPVIVLQPRRLAARSLARRIAEERGWTLGEEAGWHVRFDRKFSAATRVLVATEGILTARLQSDPLLTGFRTIVVDEFHERSLHADLALALARQAWRARDDLRIVVMSATLDTEPVAAFLDGAPVVRVEGRPFPVTVDYAPHLDPADAIRAELARTGGDVLAFLPGLPEIARLARALASGPSLGGARVVPLSGRSSPEEQDDALVPSSTRRVILATNVAETSITVPGVTAVIDTGLHKVPRLDTAIGLDRLETERISHDAAEQRAGRAGRTAPGRAMRLWDPRDVLRPHREPELARVDLAPPVLEVLAWGANPETFEWFEPPPIERLSAAMELLRLLGAVDGDRLTPLGELLRRLPVPPRLARVLVAASGSSLAVAACTVLSERFAPAGPLPAGSSDVVARADRLGEAPATIRHAAEEIAKATRRVLGDRTIAAIAAAARVEGEDDETVVRRALLAGFPDRLARRRESGSRRVVLASGHGGVLDRRSVVLDGQLLLALDVEAGARGFGAEAAVRLASRVERSWLPKAERTLEHRFDPETGSVRAVEVERIFALTLAERTTTPDPDSAFPLLVDAFVSRGVPPDQAPIVARLRFAGIELDLAAIARAACAGRTTLPAASLTSALDHKARHALDRLAPETLPLPSGRSAKLVYRDDGTVVASVKLQELFGLAESPSIGAHRTPVVFELLAPNGRPVQTTRDLKSFWSRTYPEVRKELRSRYPRHPWPEDPWAAIPTHRPKPRGE